MSELILQVKESKNNETGTNEKNFKVKTLKSSETILEKREKDKVKEIKNKFSEIFQKYKDEMSQKIELRDKKIAKLSLKINEYDAEIKRITYTTDEKHTREKNELENVILKQEELVDSLYKKNKDLLKIINSKNIEINTLKSKLKDEEIVFNRKKRIIEDEPIRNYNLISHKIIKLPANDGEIMNNNKMSETEYFKQLNKSLQDQLRGSSTLFVIFNSVI